MEQSSISLTRNRPTDPVNIDAIKDLNNLIEIYLAYSWIVHEESANTSRAEAVSVIGRFYANRS